MTKYNIYIHLFVEATLELDLPLGDQIPDLDIDISVLYCLYWGQEISFMHYGWLLVSPFNPSIWIMSYVIVHLSTIGIEKESISYYILNKDILEKRIFSRLRNIQIAAELVIRPYTKVVNAAASVWTTFLWMGPKSTTSFILIVRSFTFCPNHDMGPIFY